MWRSVWWDRPGRWKTWIRAKPARNCSPRIAFFVTRVPQSLAKAGGIFGLSSFLREHYTSSGQSADIIAAYLESVARPQAPGKRSAATKRRAKGDEKAKTGEKKPATPKSGEAKSGDLGGPKNSAPKASEPKASEFEGLRAQESFRAQDFRTQDFRAEYFSAEAARGHTEPAESRSQTG